MLCHNMNAVSQSEDRKKRAPRVTSLQIQHLVEYMLQHRNFATGLMLGKAGRAAVRQQWKHLANQLNELGSPKNVEKWQLVWKHEKIKTRKRYAAVNAAKTRSTSPVLILPLTEVERKINRIISTDTSEDIELVEVSSLGSVQNSPTRSLVPEELIIGDFPKAESTVDSNFKLSIETECSAKYSFENDVVTETEPRIKTEESGWSSLENDVTPWPNIKTEDSGWSSLENDIAAGTSMESNIATALRFKRKRSGVPAKTRINKQPRIAEYSKLVEGTNKGLESIARAITEVAAALNRIADKM